MLKNHAFLYTDREQPEKENKKQFILCIFKKNKILNNKLNQGDKGLIHWKIQNVTERD